MRVNALLPFLLLSVVPLAPALAATGATAAAETRTVAVNGHPMAYRRIGPAHGIPLLLLNRFRGTMDHWDPLLLDRIAAERPVIVFDQPGFARSGGTAPDSLSGFAASAVALLDALGHTQVDVLGFSMGGTVALQLALDHPGRVRRLIVAGSGPGFVPDMPPGVEPAGPAVWQVATKPVNDDEDFLFLFFEETASSRAAGKAYLQRLRARSDAFAKQVDAAAWQAQLRSAQAVGTASTTLLPRLARIRQPVLVANGRHDIMVPTYASYAMAQALPDARLIVYPDSGHGFLFQHAEPFARDVLEFLR
ncbi:pimeloyl-ACP methyl ester carboxylesterase [Variovorax sp. TBS-050B]|uniref:alpha/beta fold hydrolase n=1 Tax=Variovorax sp. TBS-050B TaxID=2940551 RepID=UPI0024764F5E|nr:alpha/beta hydrolase [Variovorax sp. TBS-050B]MDH6590198.1 pimeloyl-ACP methyl ester carboxylesterase [Variovorax sp. TBS-050B]